MVEQLPISLADPFTAAPVAKVIIDDLVAEDLIDADVAAELPGPDKDGGGGVAAFQPLAGVVLQQSPADIGVKVAAALSEAGTRRIPWRGLMVSVLPGLIQWAQSGYPQDGETKTLFDQVLHGAFQVAQSTTIVVESGVGQMKEATKAIGGGNLSAMGQQTRLLVHEAARRVRAAGGMLAQSLKPRQAKTAKTSLKTHTRRGAGKDVIFRTLEVTAHSASSKNIFDEAKAAAHQRKENAERAKQNERTTQNTIDFEAQRQENQKEDDFAAKVAAASIDVSKQRLNPQAFGLIELKERGRNYSKKDMAHSLAVLARRVDSAVDVDTETDRLAKLKVSQLHERLSVAFFGEEWKTKYVPREMPAEMQSAAVSKAKSMSTQEMVESNEAWAWRVEGEDADADGDGGEEKDNEPLAAVGEGEEGDGNGGCMVFDGNGE
jgi:hypothetical protein